MLGRKELASCMNFDEGDEGDYRLYCGAVEAAQGDGYIAALAVNHVRNTTRANREVFRDDSLACGHRWPSPAAALSYAVGRGREVVKADQHRLPS